MISNINYKVLILITSLAVSALSNVAYAKTELTEKQKLNYALGYMMTEGISEEFVDFDLDTFISGIRAGSSNTELLLTEDEMDQVIYNYYHIHEQKMIEDMNAKKASNLTKAEAFLAENKDKKGVKTTESGLQYKVIKEGKGGKPAKTDTVKVHYEGKLLDGTVFDSSYMRGEAIEFPLDQVIDGWVEGLQLMNKGAKYQFFIHPNLAYGEVGTVGIEPNSLLIFTVELIDFEPSN